MYLRLYTVQFYNLQESCIELLEYLSTDFLIKKCIYPRTSFKIKTRGEITYPVVMFAPQFQHFTVFDPPVGGSFSL